MVSTLIPSTVAISLTIYNFPILPGPMAHGPGSMDTEMLHMYSDLDLLILCVHLAVLLAVTLTVPGVLFPVRGDEGGPMELRDMDGWVQCMGMDVWIDGGDKSG